MHEDGIGIRVLVEALMRAATWTRSHRDLVRDLDASCGDGDLGVTIQKGFSAVENLLKTVRTKDCTISDLLSEVGITFNRAAASSFGVFFAIAFRRAGNACRKKDQLKTDDVVRMLDAAIEGVMDRGKARPGDKTLLDALVPANEALRQSQESGIGLRAGLENAARAARAGAEATQAMTAKKGRARQLGPQSEGVQDPGATVVYIFLEGLLHGQEK